MQLINRENAPALNLEDYNDLGSNILFQWDVRETWGNMW